MKRIVAEEDTGTSPSRPSRCRGMCKCWHDPAALSWAIWYRVESVKSPGRPGSHKQSSPTPFHLRAADAGATDRCLDHPRVLGDRRCRRLSSCAFLFYDFFGMPVTHRLGFINGGPSSDHRTHGELLLKTVIRQVPRTGTAEGDVGRPEPCGVVGARWRVTSFHLTAVVLCRGSPSACMILSCYPCVLVIQYPIGERLPRRSARRMRGG